MANEINLNSFSVFYVYFIEEGIYFEYPHINKVIIEFSFFLKNNFDSILFYTIFESLDVSKIDMVISNSNSSKG